ncbi:hypothetical protein L6452_01979 [Arctium lappa]|uniref:Uncharacterized protein n=1 Tax=Arctium lappa TaxID=4217 RepID=A0ACB9FHU2_ARCLA|nr:hypothetical protein L6452_01979 [Arctium lappa]
MDDSSDAIPIDLFVSKKNPRHRIITSNGFSLRFTDSCANLVFSVDPPPPILKQPRLLADSSGNPLISIAHNQKGTWQGFRKNSSEEKDLMFRVERTTNTLTRLEFQVFLTNGYGNPNNESDFKMRGSPFYRSCTIYNGNSIVAQTSLMYKLGMQKVIVPRNRFRLTIFPGGYADHAFIVALIAIFFDGRKLWI